MPRFSLGMLAFTLVLGADIPAHSQSAECPTSDCAQAARTASSSLGPLWRDAAAAHQIKLQFVEAFQRFVRAQSGTFGDEGAALTESIAAMRASLARWDQSIAQIQGRVSRLPREADAHVALATVWLDRHRLENTLQEVNAAERIASDRVDLYTLKSLALAALGRNEESARALKRAVALDSSNPTTYYRLARLQMQLQRTSDASDAWRGLERALEHPPAAGRDGDGRIAPFERVDLLRQTAGIAPVFPQPRYADGMSALRSGDYESAVARFAEAAVGDPLIAGSAEAHRRVAEAGATLREGRIDTALSQLLDAAQALPNNSEIHRLLGLIYWLDEQQGKSIEHLRTAIALAPGDERARMTLADVLVSERRYSEAERELIMTGTPSGQRLYRLSQVYQRQSLLPQSVQALKESEAFGPLIGRDYFYQSWGSLLVNQADFDGAVAAYTKRIDVNPNSAEAHRQIGEIYILQGRHDEALADLRVAAWLDPNDAKAHAAAGQVYARLLAYPEAIEALTRAVTLDPTHREARYTLGTVLMRVGKVDRAKAELDRFGRQQAEAEAAGQREFEIDALRRQAAKHLRDGDIAEGIAKLEAVATLDPRSSRSHRELGGALLRAQRAAEGIERLVKAQQLDATPEGFAQLADAYAVAGFAQESTRMRAAYVEAVHRAKLDRIRELAR
ncbi:MAG TPA: tetratricopeptide repeat protein [Vicinamibacterales bacterium]|jgi:tetratricopeptide (TPR) repeat protein